jgi:hypothetical protein
MNDETNSGTEVQPEQISAAGAEAKAGAAAQTIRNEAKDDTASSRAEGETERSDVVRAETRANRTAKGQWAKGISGNPRGRPHKKKVERKPIATHLAEALMVDVVVTNAAGKQEKISAQEAIARQLVGSILHITPKEQLAVLRHMDKLGVFSELHSLTSGQHPTLDERKQRLMEKLEGLKKKHSDPNRAEASS